jgi:hypothetical protein
MVGGVAAGIECSWASPFPLGRRAVRAQRKAREARQRERRQDLKTYGLLGAAVATMLVILALVWRSRKNNGRRIQ